MPKITCSWRKLQFYDISQVSQDKPVSDPAGILHYSQPNNPAAASLPVICRHSRKRSKFVKNLTVNSNTKQTVPI